MREQNELHQYLFGALNQFEYALIDFGLGTIYDISQHKSIDIVFEKRNMELIIAALKQFPTLANLKLSSRYSLSKINLHFKNRSVLQINFIHKFVYDLHIYLDEKTLLSKRILMNNGVFVLSLESLFEYTALTTILKRKELSDQRLSFFNDYHILVQEDLVEYFNLKYGTSMREIFDLNFHFEENRVAVFKTLKAQASNQFMGTMNIRWHHFLGAIRQARII